MKRLTPELKEHLARLHNYTPALLIDELGVIRSKTKALKEDEELIKQVLDSKLQDDTQLDVDKDALSGKNYILQIIKTSRATFSQEKAKTFLTPEQFEQCFTSSPVTQYRVTRKDTPEDNVDVESTKAKPSKKE